MKISKEIKIGVVVLFALGIFVWGYNYLKGFDLFKKTEFYYAVYDNVDGLVPNNAVKINGLIVGQVNDIFFHPDGSGRIVVKFSLENKDYKFSKQSIARIASSSLLGANSLNILPGPQGKQALPGDTLKGEIQGSIQEEVNKAILPLKNKTEQLFSSVDSVITIFRSVFNDQTRDNLRKSFDNISKTIETLAHTSSQFDTLITGQKTRLASIIANVDDITANIKNNDQKLNHIIDNIALVSDSLVKADIVGTFTRAEQALGDFSKITQKINNGEGSLGLLINDKSLYNELDSSAKSLDALIKDLNENPERYVHFSVFGRKDKSKKNKQQNKTQ